MLTGEATEEFLKIDLHTRSMIPSNPKYLYQSSPSDDTPAQELTLLLWLLLPSPPAPHSMPVALSHHIHLLPPYKTLPTPRHCCNMLNNSTLLQ